jgi:hypothetical protein
VTGIADGPPPAVLLGSAAMAAVYAKALPALDA